MSGDYRASDLWTFRGGVWMIETPIPEQTQSPNLMESDIALWSVGAKRAFGKHAVDLSYTLMLYDDRVISDNLVPAYDGRYQTHANIFQLTYSYTFN